MKQSLDKRKVPDYHFTLNKGMSKEDRDKVHTGDIWINGAVCLKCSDFVRSLNRHDFRRCKCGAIAVDGGSQYIRRMGNPSDMINVIELFGENKFYDE